MFIKITERKFELILFLTFFVFSWWLMSKSFSYDTAKSTFLIARHQVGDFGLHLSLIRSFSWGNNFPIESPFFPGKPLPYHYNFDLIVGLLEKLGVRIDLALNGLSVFSFTLLLYLIYKLPQKIFLEKRMIGLISVLLFICNSSLTFVDFVKAKGLNILNFKEMWLLPDYIHKGPFDGSEISIFFTLNVFLNQRHLILALVMGLFIIYYCIDRIEKKETLVIHFFTMGLLLGFISRFHMLIFFCSSVFILLFLILFKKIKIIPLIFLPALFIFSFHLKDIIGQDITHDFINLGFLANKPLNVISFLRFWIFNLGFSIPFMICGFFLPHKKQKKIFFCFLPLFILGNIFQFSFRIDHNHSIFNFFIIFANFYVAYFLLKILKFKITGLIIFLISLFLITFSGFLNLMAVKNDFKYPYDDAPKNKFIFWIKSHTDKDAIFLSKEEILDPVTLAGRKNYLGHDYYLSVLGYNTSKRKKLVKDFFEAKSIQMIENMRKEKIKYLVVPLGKTVDFNYRVEKDFFKNNLKTVYEDKNYLVFKL